MNDLTNDTTIDLSIRLPRQYKAFYDRLIRQGVDVGDLADIAAGGVIGYLNCVLDELQAGNEVGYAEPDIKNLHLQSLTL
ncbi:hypothetical protein [Candidatus Methanoperedens nitratireducens]|uniref:Uncharacterized protein n=1 Tax=Candidatus Methanoperedens nitratireducens TaxID=1392998 RepID=A0A284VSV3_9EURY|nr:hypothetical protein [Candidatus Methanoperedens nitroreducens]SNQ62278.1 hypothetical protein MNV_660016 [Candidatus Methanoperedens nitroreducens]